MCYFKKRNFKKGAVIRQLPFKQSSHELIYTIFLTPWILANT